MNFKLWLENTEATVPSEFIGSNGMITLYRFSQRPRGDQYLIDPEQAKKSPSSYSRQEFRTAWTSRTFFYLDPGDRERMVGQNLYEAQVPANQIYNLLKDPLELKAQALPNFDKLFKLVIEAGFKGVYYKPPQGHIVAMFAPVVGTAVNLDDVMMKRHGKTA